MGLTKPRAAQIYNLDYKQSTRVVTTTNITLSGGAPNSVDGVNLVLGDRILVTGQTTGSQNGLYYVTTLGSGANGTWARTSDGNETGEIEAGMIIMVTEGTIYADTQWKLITNDPIVIGTTALTFTQNYLANSISSGTSNVVVNSNADVTISSAGTANVLTVSSTGTVTTGAASVTGNVTANYFLGNVACASGIFSSRIFNGVSEANIGASGGNANISIGGTSNVAVFATTGQFITGLISATGNVTGANLNTAGNISASGNIAGNYLLANIYFATGFSASRIFNGTSEANIGTSSGNANITIGGVSNVVVFSTTGQFITGLLSVTGNITGGNISATNHTGTNVSVTGTVTGSSVVGGSITISGNNITGSGSTLTIDPNGAGGTDGAVVIAGNLSVQGNVTYIDSNVITTNEKSITLANNVNTGSAADGSGIDVGNNTLAFWRFNNATTSWQSNIALTPSANGTLNLGGTSNYWATIYATGASVSGNVTGGNLLTAGIVSSTSNVTGGNIQTAGQISATGNITGSNVIGNTNAIKTIAVTGSSNIVASTDNQTVKFTATVASGITISADVPNSTITFDTAGSGDSIFASGGDMGTVTEAVTSSEDLGLVTEAVTVNYDLGSVIDATGLVYPSQLVLPTYTSSTLPGTNPAGQFIYLSTSSVGAMTAFSDGTNWRFTSSGNIVS